METIIFFLSFLFLFFVFASLFNNKDQVCLIMMLRKKKNDKSWLNGVCVTPFSKVTQKSRIGCNVGDSPVFSLFLVVYEMIPLRMEMEGKKEK